jgi:hypothetical protein
MSLLLAIALTSGPAHAAPEATADGDVVPAEFAPAARGPKAKKEKPPKEAKKPRPPKGQRQLVDDAAPAADLSSNTAVDIEDRKSKVETQAKPLQVSLGFETEFHTYDNLDFRALDESTDQAIFDSDDKASFAFSGLQLDLGYQPDPTVRFVLGASYRGMWGGDQFGAITRFNSLLYFTSAYVEWTPDKIAWRPRFRVGRQRFDLGGIGGAREYVFADVIDAVRADLPLGKLATLTVLPVDVVGLSVDNDDVTLTNFVGRAQSSVFGFRGDRMTTRHGAMLTVNPVKDLDTRAYFFYTDIAAAGTGSDISYNGRLGNFSDNDWVANWGVRASYTIADKVTPWGEFAGSFGIDRKELVAQDVSNQGLAWGAGVTANLGDKDVGVRGDLSYWEAQGGVYSDNGLQYSHGYVGMKGRQVGGVLANRFLGWHPSAYVGVGGVSDTPQDRDRRAGTRVISLTADADLPGPVGLNVGWWSMWDTGLTTLDPDENAINNPPFGYTREEFEAEFRLGKPLGHEANLGASVDLGKYIQIFAQGGILLPGAFYGQVINRVAGNALGSDDPQMAWDVNGGTRVTF